MTQMLTWLSHPNAVVTADVSGEHMILLLTSATDCRVFTKYGKFADVLCNNEPYLGKGYGSGFPTWAHVGIFDFQTFVLKGLHTILSRLSSNLFC